MSEGAAPEASMLLGAAQLRALGRTLPSAFSIELADAQFPTLLVSKVLRHLPARRLVAQATGATGTIIVLKVFLDAARGRDECAREVHGIELMQRAGVPTQEVIAHTHTIDGAPCLLLRYFSPATTIRLPDPLPTRECPSDVSAAFALLGRLHGGGAIHTDAHMGNFLKVGAGGTAISGAVAAETTLRLLDGDAIAPVPAQPDKAAQTRLQNLALLAAQLYPAQWRAWQGELLAAYQPQNRTQAHTHVQRQAYEVLADHALGSAVRDAFAYRLRHYLKKSVRECSEFSCQRSAQRLVLVRREVMPQLAGLLDDPDAALAGGQLLKDGNTCTVARVRAGGLDLVVKRYNIKSLAHALSRAWRPSRAWHSWRNGHHLGFVGIPTPRPLAMIEERAGPLRRRAWLVCAWQAGQTVDKVLSDPAAVLPGQLIERLQEVLVELRAQRIGHGDMKASNFLWDGERAWVIDLDAMSPLRANQHARYERAWCKDRDRLAANWTPGSPARAQIDAMLSKVEQTVPITRP